MELNGGTGERFCLLSRDCYKLRPDLLSSSKASRFEVRSTGSTQCQADADQRISCIAARLPDEQGRFEAT